VEKGGCVMGEGNGAGIENFFMYEGAV
jgi:hypothetical protein